MADSTVAVQPRARGEVRLAVRASTGRAGAPGTALADLYQSGSLKALFPRHSGAALQAVLVNTAGGVTGGDEFQTAADIGPGAALTLTTQAAERAYRAAGGAQGRINNHVAVAGRLNWLPQETILFQGCDLDRRLTVDLAPGASALVVEPLVFGRLAMGEVLTSARLHDRIEIRRDGALIYLDALGIGPDVAGQLARTALGQGARALATVILADPRAEALLPRVRDLLPGTAGASLLREGLICARILAEDGYTLRATLHPLLTLLSGEELPRPWMI